MNNNNLIYDWDKINDKSVRFPPNVSRIELFDETLRDGLQSTYVHNPSLSEKIEFLESANKLGIPSLNIGMPMSGTKHLSDCIALAKYIRTNKLQIKPACIGRALVRDVEVIAQVSQASGTQIIAHLLGGSSEMRHLIEKWDIKDVGKRVKDSVECALKNNLIVNFMTEDTTRAHPESIDYLFNVGIDSGATIICISDTVGIATPWSAYNLVSFIKRKIVKNQNVKIDWHGHNDRGLAVANSLIALSAGADRIHATALGVGERAGNASLEELIVNMHLFGVKQKNLPQITEYTNCAAKILKYRIPPNKPLLGSGVFSSATGIHVAAIKKAIENGDNKLAGIVYSFLDPKDLGREMEFLVSPLSGKSNVELIFNKNKIPVTSEIVDKILNLAKTKNKIFNEKQVLQLAKTIR